VSIRAGVLIARVASGSSHERALNGATSRSHC
jgi:hypothetical protein